MPLQNDYRWRRRIMRFGLQNVIFRFWFQVHVEGWDNIPREGPTLMMINHISTFDPPVMIALAPWGRDIVPLAKLEAFHTPMLRLFVGQWGAIPVDRGEGDTSAIKSALRHMADGDIVMLFVEGTRSPTGLKEGEDGSVYLAMKANAQVVPVAIWGTRSFPSSYWRDFRTAPINIKFGEPFKFKTGGQRRLPREHFQDMTGEAMYRIAGLLPPEWRGIYSDMSQATTDHLEFL